MASQPAEPRTLSEAPAPDPTPGRQAAPISEASSLPPEPAPITPAGPDETPMSPPLGQWFAPSSGAPAIEQPDTPLKLWSGWEVGWIAFWLGFPGGLALAARNWFRMGRRPWAAGHLIAGGVGFALFVVLPDSAVRGLALLLNIGLAFYLYRQTESDIASLEATDRPIETASWVSGIATSLAATALLVGVVAVPFAFSFIADTAPATTLSAFFGESFDRLPADQREQLERRFEAAVGDNLKGLPATDAAARVNARAAGGMPRFDDATLVERLRLLTVALEATPTTTCAAFGRAALTGTPNPDAVSTMLGSLERRVSAGGWRSTSRVSKPRARARLRPDRRLRPHSTRCGMLLAGGTRLPTTRCSRLSRGAHRSRTQRCARPIGTSSRRRSRLARPTWRPSPSTS